MEIPYETTARPDTGLYNAKLGIWLFLASEVMLFGGLFSAYIFLRLGAPEGFWPHGLLNVPVGTMNTAILIGSSVTVVLAWAALKMRQFAKYKLYMGITIVCGILFLVVKLAYEWPEKFKHFGVYIKQESLEKYEPYLGNGHLRAKGLEKRIEITGHLHGVEIVKDGHHEHVEIHSPSELTKLQRQGAQIQAYEIALDPASADPTNPENERPHFWPHKASEKIAKIDKADVQYSGVFAPRHSSYFAVYFTITGLHGLHVLAGVIVFIYFWLPVGANLYKTNPEHLANRIEVSGLFWHFVDLVWIFVFPIFYLL